MTRTIKPLSVGQSVISQLPDNMSQEPRVKVSVHVVHEVSLGSAASRKKSNAIFYTSILPGEQAGEDMLVMLHMACTGMGGRHERKRKRSTT